MSSSRRHWKESIGVMPRRPGAEKKRPKSPAPAAKDLPADEHDTAPQSVSAEDTAPQSRDAGDTAPQPAPSRQPVAVREVAVERQPPTRSATERVRSQDRLKTALAPMERVLDSLPSGSMDFSRQVRAKLWPDASPDDLRRLSVIVEGRGGLDERERGAAVKAVVLSQRCRNLPGGNDEISLDPVMLVAHGNEWRRIAQVAKSLLDELPADSEVPALAAARELVPPDLHLAGRAALAGAMAEIIEAGRGQAFGGSAQALPMIPESEFLLPKLCGEVVDGEDAVLLRLLAALAFSHTSVQAADPERLAIAKALLAEIGAELERLIDMAMHARKRDAEHSSRLAAWRRRTAAFRTRVDEALTRPELDGSSVSASAPDTAVEQDAGKPARAEDEKILEHLRQIRGGDQSAALTITALLRRHSIFLAIAGGILAVLLLAQPLLPRVVPAPIAVSPEAFSDIVRLSQTDAAGTLLIATADPVWKTMNAESRRTAATRLMTAAEAMGFRAGLIISADGTPLAGWSIGQAPELRRSSLVTAPLEELSYGERPRVASGRADPIFSP